MNPNRLGWFSAGQTPCDPMPPVHDNPSRLVLLGPPGVGKGTQATLLCQRLRACHLSTGDLFRAAKCDGSPSPAMQAALDAMSRGELVSDDLVIATVRERATCLSCRGGFLLDGFPRTVQQAEALDAMLAELNVPLDAAVQFSLPIEQIVERLSGRRTCGDCKAVYHVSSNPPQVGGVCDQCGGDLIVREDDQPESIRVRMEAYEAETQPLTEFYATAGKLLEILADGSPGEIAERTMMELEQIGVGQ